jgi:hypothetical protein
MDITTLEKLANDAIGREVHGTLPDSSTCVIGSDIVGVWTCWLYRTGGIAADDIWRAESLDELVEIGWLYKHVNVLNMRLKEQA